MKASKLIEDLQEMINEHGDLEVVNFDNEWSYDVEVCGTECKNSENGEKLIALRVD